jgi:hypothetical protein
MPTSAFPYDAGIEAGYFNAPMTTIADVIGGANKRRVSVSGTVTDVSYSSLVVYYNAET